MLGWERLADVGKTINQFSINPAVSTALHYATLHTFINDFLGFASGLSLGWKMAARSFTEGSLGMELEYKSSSLSLTESSFVS